MQSKILGIDFGTKRVGISISDEGQRVAFPLVVLQNLDSLPKKLVSEIEKICKENAVKEIVLGESKDFSGLDNSIMPKVRELKKDLEDLGFVIHFHPEFLTSAQVERNFGKNDMLDASASALILQSFLDTKNTF
jgi:putative Holliday junction resolvase